MSFGVGDTFTITISVKAIRGNTPGFDANLLRLGLPDSTNLGGSTVLAGATLGANNTGVFRLGDHAAAGKVDSITLNSDYQTFWTSITKTATTNEFSVESNFAGTTITGTVTDATLYNAASVYALLLDQGQTNVGGLAVDSLSIQTGAIPEPSKMGLLALTLMGVVLRRSRQA